MNENKQEWKKDIEIIREAEERNDDIISYPTMDVIIERLAEAREDCIRTSNSGRKMYDIGARDACERVLTEVVEWAKNPMNSSGLDQQGRRWIELPDLLAFADSLKKK